jgi:hypothetical protein
MQTFIEGARKRGNGARLKAGDDGTAARLVAGVAATEPP